MAKGNPNHDKEGKFSSGNSSKGFDKLYTVHLKNQHGEISKQEFFASSEKAAIKLAKDKKAKALIKENWDVHKVDKA